MCEYGWVNHILIVMAKGKWEKLNPIYVLIIISGVGNRMNMYDIKKMHKMSVLSRNLSVKCHPFSANGNERMSFWKSVAFLQER